MTSAGVAAQCFRKTVPASTRPEIAARVSWTNVRRSRLATRSGDECTRDLMQAAKTEIPVKLGEVRGGPYRLDS